MQGSRTELKTIHNLLTEAELVLSTSPDLPQNRTPRSLELIRTALVLTDDLLKQEQGKPAAVMGHKGGSVTAERFGPEHFRKLAALRKTKAGGRPRKYKDNN